MKTRRQIESQLKMIDHMLKHKRADLDHNRSTHDWHGCQDSASDIRDLVSLQRGLQWVLGTDNLWGE